MSATALGFGPSSLAEQQKRCSVSILTVPLCESDRKIDTRTEAKSANLRVRISKDLPLSYDVEQTSCTKYLIGVCLVSK